MAIMMRGLDCRLLTLIFGGTCAALSACAIPLSARGEGEFQLSFAAGSLDSAGHLLGGTEVRLLTGHGGKLYAGNGYWQDRPGPEGLQGAQILILDESGARWRVDHSFDEVMPSGRPRNLAISALSEVSFATDGTGARLPGPVSLLIASTWDLTGTTRIFSRDDATGAWTAVILAQDRPAPDFLPQVRSFGAHRDRQTGIDLVFAGQDPRGVFSGGYDATVPGGIRWGATPELDISRISTSAFPGLAGRLRISSFAECNGRLYAAVGQQIYERIDGAAPHWRLVYTNPHPRRSETGLRGLTAVPGPSGSGEVLLAAVEGDGARIIRVDPNDGSEATDLDLETFLSNRWQTRVSYVIAAYNDMARIRDNQRGDLLLIGLEAFILSRVPAPSGHSVVDVGYGRLDAGGWYLVRYPDGRYDLRQITASPMTGQALVATRSIAVSPFPNDGGSLYFAGYDANKAPAHNTAWIFRASLATALGASH
jgi:hypothetical protein